MIQHDQVHIASSEGGLQISPELRLNTKTWPIERRGVHVHRHVDIAQSTGVTARLRAKEVGLLYLEAPLEQGARALD